jgi:hypothetical protein
MVPLSQPPSAPSSAAVRRENVATYFDETDLADDRPVPGYYKSTISTARFRTSASGNDMIQVVHALEGVPPGHDRVAEYFVLSGGTARGLAMSRRRLVKLYRACGVEPRQGVEIEPADLLGAQLEVRVEHDEWQGQRRLRVAGHRPRAVPF